MFLKTRAKDLDLSQPRIMGIINVTPDSFSDGGECRTPEAAIARAEELIEAGADILDVGGESTRPGAPAVPLEEELARVLPVAEVLCARFPGTPVSVDTSKAEVARRALEAGVSVINDVTALRGDPAMAALVREHEVPVVLMHMQGDPRTMQKTPAYGDVVREVKDFFRERLAAAKAAGIREDRVLLDPGIGFGKTLEHNLELLRRLAELDELGRPLVIGTSRKSFIDGASRRAGASDGVATIRPSDRGPGTIASNLWAVQAGVRVLRVHDVKAMRQALSVWKGIAGYAAR